MEAFDIDARSITLFADELFSFFCFLQDVFYNEFIFMPGRSSQVKALSIRAQLPASISAREHCMYI